MSRTATKIAQRLTFADVAALKAVGVNERARFRIFETSDLADAWKRLELEELVEAESTGTDELGRNYTEYVARSAAKKVYDVIERADAIRHGREVTPWGGHPVPDLEIAAMRYVVAASANRRGALSKWRGGVPYWLKQLMFAVRSHDQAGPVHMAELRRIELLGPQPMISGWDPSDIVGAAANWTAWAEGGIFSREGREETRARARRLFGAINRVPDVDPKVRATWFELTGRDDDGNPREPGPFPPDLLANPPDPE